eukprot:TRINITY_DN9642_c0_g1_i1.p1 TRINITY_DN9642_c0_g1~~TRINITY_DN9642_c0_g1_i1.p1  ORF type:complete len:675 (+),score=98.31 TRINITY_DN9642_c0_g1_i1:76-2100(+)
MEQDTIDWDEWNNKNGDLAGNADSELTREREYLLRRQASLQERLREGERGRRTPPPPSEAEVVIDTEREVLAQERHDLATELHGLEGELGRLMALRDQGADRYHVRLSSAEPLGLEYEECERGGVMITSVAQWGTAHTSGIQPGATVVGLQGCLIRNGDDLAAAITKCRSEGLCYIQLDAINNTPSRSSSVQSVQLPVKRVSPFRTKPALRHSSQNRSIRSNSNSQSETSLVLKGIVSKLQHVEDNQRLLVNELHEVKRLSLTQQQQQHELQTQMEHQRQQHLHSRMEQQQRQELQLSQPQLHYQRPDSTAYPEQVPYHSAHTQGLYDPPPSSSQLHSGHYTTQMHSGQRRKVPVRGYMPPPAEPEHHDSAPLYHAPSRRISDPRSSHHDGYYEAPVASQASHPSHQQAADHLSAVTAAPPPSASSSQRLAPSSVMLSVPAQASHQQAPAASQASHPSQPPSRPAPVELYSEEYHFQRLLEPPPSIAPPPSVVQTSVSPAADEYNVGLQSPAGSDIQSKVSRKSSPVKSPVKQRYSVPTSKGYGSLYPSEVSRKTSMVRKSSEPGTPPDTPPSLLRFRVGDRVTCNVGNGRWKTGTVKATRWKGKTWGTDQQAVPYKIEIDGTKELVYAPADDDRVVHETVDNSHPPLPQMGGRGPGRPVVRPPRFRAPPPRTD